MSTPEIDVAAMSPEQATAHLATLALTFRGGPPPADEPAPKNATEASAKLATRTADPEFRTRLLNGHVETRAEFNALTAMVAEGGDLVGAAMNGVVPENEITTDGHASLRNIADATTELRKAGLSDPAIREVMADAKQTRTNVDLASQRQLERHGDPEWCKRLLAGGHAEVREQTLLSVILAAEVDESK